MAETVVTAAIEIDLWLWRLDLAADVITRLAGVLSEDERARATRFLNPRHGADYVAGRGRLREILGGYLHLDPTQLAFAYGRAGKPTLAQPALPLHFNLSHSGPWAALAVTAQHPVGIDIETVRPIGDDIARRYFTPSEAHAIAATSTDARATAFVRCWTRKEAFVKATGDGLGCPLQSFEVTVREDEPPRLVAITGRTVAEVARWHLLDFNPAPGMAGAIALDAGSAEAIVTVRRRE